MHILPEDAGALEATSIDARRAAALGCNAEVDTEARVLLYMLGVRFSGGDPWPSADFAGRGCGGVEASVRCPSSDTALPADRWVMVPFRVGRIVVDPASSESDSPESEDSDDVDIAVERTRPGELEEGLGDGRTPTGGRRFMPGREEEGVGEGL